jgi:hypothetical protein
MMKANDLIIYMEILMIIMVVNELQKDLIPQNDQLTMNMSLILKKIHSRQIVILIIITIDIVYMHQTYPH